jgi:hypothetical protein
MTTKQNPKYIEAQKKGKAPLEYLVPTMDELDAAVHKHGADKYGKFNWRIDEILATTYVGAMRRHLKSWISGEDLDPESGKPHLTHLRACCAVVLDAEMHGKLIDDRLAAESKGAPVAMAALDIGIDNLPLTPLRVRDPDYPDSTCDTSCTTCWRDA